MLENKNKKYLRENKNKKYLRENKKSQKQNIKYWKKQ